MYILVTQVATLERTLEQMAASNQAYNKSYKPVNEKRAFAERSKLRERLDKLYDRLKFKRQEERNLMGDVWQAEQRVQQLQHEHDALLQVVQELGRHKGEALAAVQVRNLHGAPMDTTW
jgi:DNA integrity scanning protein DisA with diadenylate cyclase activity